jgi:hypothetical protein
MLPGHRRSCRPRLRHPRSETTRLYAAVRFSRRSTSSISPRSPLPGVLSRRRNRLTRSTGTLGGSAAYLPGPLRPLSLLLCVSAVHRTLRAGSAPHVWPFAAVRTRLLWPWLTSRSTGRAVSKRSAQRRPFRRKARSPRVRRVTFTPSTRRIYDRPVRSAFGLQVSQPPRPPRGRLVCGSCSSGRSFAYSFLPASPHEATVAVQLGVPGTQGPQGTLTPKSLPAQLSPCGCQRQSRRCAPCLAHCESPRPGGRGLSCSPALGGRAFRLRRPYS